MQGVASENVAILGVIDPDAYTASTVTTAWVKADDFHRFMAIVFAGDLGTSATLDAKIEQANTSGGGGAKDVTSAAITQLTQAGTDDNKQAIINFDADDLDTENSFYWVRLSMTVATATSDAGGVLLGVVPRYGPGSDFDATTVDEIVTTG